jgi:hypothetical protein
MSFDCGYVGAQTCLESTCFDGVVAALHRVLVCSRTPVPQKRSKCHLLVLHVGQVRQRGGAQTSPLQTVPGPECHFQLPMKPLHYAITLEMISNRCVLHPQSACRKPPICSGELGSPVKRDLHRHPQTERPNWRPGQPCSCWQWCWTKEWPAPIWWIYQSPSECL